MGDYSDKRGRCSVPVQCLDIEEWGGRNCNVWRQWTRRRNVNREEGAIVGKLTVDFLDVSPEHRCNML